jgi:hypothetical protein
MALVKCMKGNVYASFPVEISTFRLVFRHAPMKLEPDVEELIMH